MQLPEHLLMLKIVLTRERELVKEKLLTIQYHTVHCNNSQLGKIIIKKHSDDWSKLIEISKSSFASA
jgi:hypothetical protein